MQIKHHKKYKRGIHILVTFCNSWHVTCKVAHPTCAESASQCTLSPSSTHLTHQDQSRCLALVSNILSSQQMDSIRYRGVVYSIYSMIAPDPSKFSVLNYIQSIKQSENVKAIFHNSDILYLLGLNMLLESFFYLWLCECTYLASHNRKEKSKETSTHPQHFYMPPFKWPILSLPPDLYLNWILSQLTQRQKWQHTASCDHNVSSIRGWHFYGNPVDHGIPVRFLRDGSQFH